MIRLLRESFAALSEDRPNNPVRTDSGAAVPAGVYFARIERNGEVRSEKMLLLR